MTPRENVMAVLHGEQPDCYGDIFDAVQFVFDPVFTADTTPQDGKAYPDPWGTVFRFLPGAPGRHPYITEENRVIKDLGSWKKQLVIPSLKDYDWSAAAEEAAAVDRRKMFCTIFSPSGLFERTHYLMGMENALMAYLEEPDDMYELLRAIADYKIEYLKLAAYYLKPDMVFFHDDWGNKLNVFLPPKVWRELIKPLHTEIVRTAHECGMMFMHHSDSFCQPLAADMLEMGIDVWQGVIPQNDIVEIQRVTGGRLPMVGGIDGPKIDIEDITEEEIRSEVRRAFDTYCPGGPFFPSVPNGCCFREWNDSIVLDEIAKYGKIYPQKHPVG